MGNKVCNLIVQAWAIRSERLEHLGLKTAGLDNSNSEASNIWEVQAWQTHRNNKEAKIKWQLNC